jgi:hypothetical protein
MSEALSILAKTPRSPTNEDDDDDEDEDGEDEDWNTTLSKYAGLPALSRLRRRRLWKVDQSAQEFMGVHATRQDDAHPGSGGASPTRAEASVSAAMKNRERARERLGLTPT